MANNSADRIMLYPPRGVRSAIQYVAEQEGLSMSAACSRTMVEQALKIGWTGDYDRVELYRNGKRGQRASKAGLMPKSVLDQAEDTDAEDLI